MSILFVTPKIAANIGGGVFTASIDNTLCKFADSYFKFSIPPYRSAVQKIKYQPFGYTLGMTPKVEAQIIEYIEHNQPDVIVFNTSYYGKIIKTIKKKYPKIKVLCFFHNIECVYVKAAFKRKKNIGQLLTIYATWRNELSAVRYSDKVICLNKRDANDLMKIYGRTADALCPICLPDAFDESKLHKRNGVVGAFVGSNFFANYYGLCWFVKNVAPNINTSILIIGRGFEQYRKEFEQYPNIKVIGTVDNLSDHYYDIDFIIVPIFDGSGMKTKTAEALMFGKTIFGTDEAFCGYDVDLSRVGALCNTAEEFIDAINNFQKSDMQFNQYCRSAYMNNYSEDRISEIMKTLIKL